MMGTAINLLTALAICILIPLILYILSGLFVSTEESAPFLSGIEKVSYRGNYPTRLVKMGFVFLALESLMILLVLMKNGSMFQAGVFTALLLSSVVLTYD